MHLTDDGVLSKLLLYTQKSKLPLVFSTQFLFAEMSSLALTFGLIIKYR